MLRLKEKPVEWIKFTAVIGVAVNLVAWMLWWRGRMAFEVPIATAVGAALAVGTALVRPRWFRGFYRGGMTVSFHIGQVIGKVLLTLFFFLVVTPMGLLLRLFGKDLLHLHWDRQDTTWWQPAKNSRQFDRMF